MAQQPNVFTTPKGIALYPWLSTPDTKFNEEGEYKVNLVLSKEAAQPIINQINEAFSENLKEEMKKHPGKELKTANPPYHDELDDAGQPTGNVIFRFKSKAIYKPAIFDAKGGVVVDSNIWAGSEIRVNASIAPYYTSMVGAGVALRLRAVQIITLVEGSQGAADRFGFEETAGYVHKEDATPMPEVFADATPAGMANALANGRDAALVRDELVASIKDGASIQEAITRAGNKVPPQPAPMPEVAEPEVVKKATSSSGSDIADIVSKWGVKD